MSELSPYEEKLAIELGKARALIEELEAKLARIRREALEEAAGVADRMQGAGSEAIRNAIRALADNRDEINAILLKAAGKDRG